MYHSISARKVDPFALSVRPEDFEHQMQSLQKYCFPVRLEDLPNAIAMRKKNPVAVTFDDGYRDNFLTAAPILARYHIPASFFICTGINDPHKSSWWETLSDLLLDNTNPLHKKASEIILNQIQSVHPATLKQLNNELDLFVTSCQLLKKMNLQDRETFLLPLIPFLGKENNNLWLSDSEIAALSQHELFDIGAHSHHHLSMTASTKQDQEKEVSRSIHILAHVTGKTIHSFAYPFGDCSETAMDVLAKNGIKLAVTTHSASVNNKVELLKIPRIHMKNMEDTKTLSLFKHILSW